MKLSICSDALFMGQDYIESMKVLGSAGYKDIEFWTWWDKDIDVLAALKKSHGLNYTAFCTKFISLVDSSKRAEYRQGLVDSIAVAKKLDCNTLISQVGDELTDITRQAQYDSLVTGLREMAPLLEGADITLVIEPLNTRVDHEGYYLWSSKEAFRIIEEVDSPKIKVLFDIYHQQIMEGDLTRSIRANIDKIGHFHIAGNPGRHEPYGEVCELNYQSLIKSISELNYDKYIGCEYFPQLPVMESLKILCEVLKV
jgi:hydroxypyruvate isomerase